MFGVGKAESGLDFNYSVIRSVKSAIFRLICIVYTHLYVLKLE